MQIFADKIFENPVEIIEAFDNESFIRAFSRIEILRKRSGTYLLGYIRYEAKDIFLGKKIKSKYPLLYFEIYKDAKTYKGIDAKHISYSPQLFPYSTINYKTYSKAIEKIKEEIAEGNTYEVNYTYDYKIESDLSGFDLYNLILPRQKTSYNAYIKNKYEEILSFSPELFFEGVSGANSYKIRTKPMKGTIQRGKTDKEDKENIEFLKNDIKNKAENVMIVDLLRNDLGKIAKTGTVKIDKLFEIETHPTLHQMTSEISAELEENITLYDIFNAIFPCGSITGAPKISTMKIIEQLETRKRGVYCGAIGLIAPEKTIFSVPIRILQGVNGSKYEEVNAGVNIINNKNIKKIFTCSVGGAIVWDSTAQEEWQETLTKIKFLGGGKCRGEWEIVNGKGENPDAAIQENNGLLHCVRNDLKLVETILVKDGKLIYEKEHFERMGNSAKELGFKFIKDAKMHRCIEAKKINNGILRILLNKNGILKTQELTLESIKTNKITLSKSPVNSKETLLYHKTTYRPWYEKSMEKIKNGEIFDEIFFNQKGELTEGARSNIILQIGGECFTPPVNCGLLNGILRQKMLDENKIKEKILYLEDLEKAEKIFCINSVRGIIEVNLLMEAGIVL